MVISAIFSGIMMIYMWSVFMPESKDSLLLTIGIPTVVVGFLILITYGVIKLKR